MRGGNDCSGMERRETNLSQSHFTPFFASFFLFLKAICSVGFILFATNTLVENYLPDMLIAPPLTINTPVRASLYEPSNRVGSVTGTNIVLCSHGKFWPNQPE